MSRHHMSGLYCLPINSLFERQLFACTPVFRGSRDRLGAHWLLVGSSPGSICSLPEGVLRSCAPTAAAVHASLSKVVTQYEKRSTLIQKLVLAAGGSSDQSSRIERELRATIRERDAALAELRREVNTVERTKLGSQVGTQMISSAMHPNLLRPLGLDSMPMQKSMKQLQPSRRTALK